MKTLLFRALGLLGALLAIPALHATNIDVNVVVDMSPEGRKLPHPDHDHPAYYAPWLRGYFHLGTPVPGDPPPSQHDIVRQLAPQLARQGYFVVDAAHPTPQILLAISWGYISPSDDTQDQGTGIADFGTDGHDPDATDTDVHLRMQALVMGHTLRDLIMLEAPGHTEFMEAANEARYFIVVTAFDYPSWQKSRKRVVLWTAKMSIPMGGVHFNDVTAALARAGGQAFGHESLSRPTLTPFVPDGQVNVGTPRVKE